MTSQHWRMPRCSLPIWSAWALSGVLLAGSSSWSQEAVIPAGQAPATIQPESTRKVKKAAVYLKVMMDGGESAEGSGFFAMEPGIVLTNAHVVGMLQTGSKPPKKIDIVANSGEADEFTVKGVVLGVDRDNDLAVLRVQEEKARWPAPLPVEFDMSNLTELQKVYIFGFPLGTGLGREITASESSISSSAKTRTARCSRFRSTGACIRATREVRSWIAGASWWELPWPAFAARSSISPCPGKKSVAWSTAASRIRAWAIRSVTRSKSSCR